MGQVKTVEEMLKQASGAFSDFKSAIVNTIPFEQLGIGWHDVEIRIAMITNDFIKGLRNPTLKDASERPPWDDPTDQLAVYFSGDNNKGATRRFARYGYWKFDDLLEANPTKAALCVKMGSASQGYAVFKDDNVRAMNQEKTDKATAILQRFLTCAGVAVDTPGDELPEVLEGKHLKIQIGSKVYNEKEYLDVVNFAEINTPESELKRIPVPEGIVTALPAVADTETGY